MGFSIGGPEDEVFYIMETHYDNPNRRSDIIDDSGIRITITPTLRQHEAGMWQLGHTVTFYQLVPPGLKDFVTRSYCSAECLSDVVYSSLYIHLYIDILSFPFYKSWDYRFAIIGKISVIGSLGAYVDIHSHHIA